MFALECDNELMVGCTIVRFICAPVRLDNSFSR